MAKNLKLNIKNAQLAAVLKKSKGEEKEVPSKKGAAVAEIVEESSKPKRIVRARKLPSFHQLEKPFEPETQKEEEAALLPPTSAPEERALEAPHVEDSATIRDAALEPKLKEKPAPAPVTAQEDRPRPVRKPAGREETPEEETGPKKGIKPGDKPVKKASPLKRQSFTRVFDSRDRQGLTAGDDVVWRKKRNQRSKMKMAPEDIIRPKEITVKLPISVKDLAAQMKVKANEVIQKLFIQGMPIRINDFLDDEVTVALIGDELGCAIHIDTREESRLKVVQKTISEEIAATDPAKQVPRPPVVTIMGHIDHGKTSIIDSFRKSNIISTEAGAITQHIGAFSCHTKHGDFTVLDTPGHEAFTAIRERGAHVTDIAVVVIAGDEGIKPQTEEAIAKAREANVPIIVAVNKMDKPGFNLDNVYRQMADHNLLPEAWGGTIISVSCSAKTGAGMDTLAEMIALQSEVLELKSNPDADARGTVLDSELHKGLGATATLLIQNGTLRLGDAILFEYEYGRIKTMHDEHGNNLQKADASKAVQVTGLSGVPPAGNEFVRMESEKEARKISDGRKAGMQREMMRKSKKRDIEGIFQKQIESSAKKSLNLIIKADVGSSIEALKKMLGNLPSDKVELHIVAEDVGQIAESDVYLAEASGAIIVGFHTNIEPHAEPILKELNVKVFKNNVIYHLVDTIREEMRVRLDKIREETKVGEANVIAVFKASTLGSIAGCTVTDGMISRRHAVKVVRNKEMIFEGTIRSLKRHQDDVKEVVKGVECGILIDGFNKIEVGDTIESYEVTYREQQL